ncbi:11-oxo-beta-amyrin 30-oxidase [Porphyridium purpureum]|uniref:11-oxo-beta-amyrin 30-oxidase n=1 Tax=Porphyridium purpureum TaxID=35688 RepID=A0A5J4YN27_PORPP|nr:11-oxo-beta-amyrin 30-oxidase [Porphyridium purpureum]|eukprot:POR7845..scf222_8
MDGMSMLWFGATFAAGCVALLGIGLCVLVAPGLVRLLLRHLQNEKEMAALVKAGVPQLPPTEPVHRYARCHAHVFPLVGVHESTRYLVQMARMLGSEVFVVRFITGAPRVVISSLSGIRHVLFVNLSNYVRAPLARQTLSDLVGESSVILAEGPEHARLRRMVHSMFKASSLLDAAPIFFKLARELVEQWRPACSTEHGAVQHHVEQRMVTFALDAILQYSFNSSAFTDELAAAYSTIFGGDDDPILLMMLERMMFPWLKWTSPTLRRRQKAVRSVRELSRAAVEDRQRQRTASQDVDHESEPQDMLDKLLDAQDPENPSGMNLSQTEVVDQILTNFSAGQATTSVVMSWGLWVLASNAVVQQNVHQHVSELQSSEKYCACTSDSARLELLDQLEYLDWFIYELMRLYLPVPFMTRVTLADDIIDGWLVPKGTTCVTDLAALMLSRDIFGEDVDTFRPERWAPGPANPRALAQREVLSVLPFSIGPHSCLGRRFALFEIKVVLSSVLTAFHISLPAGATSEKEPKRCGFLGSPSNVSLCLSQRN